MHPELGRWIDNRRQYPDQNSVESINSILDSLKVPNIVRTEEAQEISSAPNSSAVDEQKDAKTDDKEVDVPAVAVQFHREATETLADVVDTPTKSLTNI